MIQQMQTLIDEHGRIRSMLSCFEAQLDRFERAEMPDYEILGGSIAYCQEYLDRWHHPRENALLELLRRRAPAKAELCSGLEDQHLGLAGTAEELANIFEAVRRDAQYSRTRLVEMGRALLIDYRRHLDWEETNFFPAATDNLLPEDWREVAMRFADGIDPLVQSPVDRRYRTLFNAIDGL